MDLQSWCSPPNILQALGLEMELCPILAYMTVDGICFDASHLRQYIPLLDDRVRAITREACQAAGMEFSLSSPEQVAHILYDRLGLEVIYTPVLSCFPLSRDGLSL